MTITHFRIEERERIEKLLKEGASYKAISVLLSRTIPSIKNEINKNGGRAGYTAKKSQVRYNAAKTARSTKLKEHYKKLYINGNFSPKVKKTLNSRMNVLEDQIKFILEALKKLTNGRSEDEQSH